MVVVNNPTTSTTFSAPNGQDTFLIQTYDEPNAQGHVLSQALLTQTVSGSSANIVSATLNGVIASLALSVSPLQPTGGVPSTMTVSAAGLDADGNVIVGPGSFDSPIQLSIVDPANTGALSLSTATIQTPGTTSTLNYNGKTLSSASIVASATGVPSASVTVAPVPGFAFYPVPTANAVPFLITADAANNLWFTENSADKIGELPSGSTTFSEYTIPTAASAPAAITIGNDGRVWFAEQSGGNLGALTPGGSIAEYSTGGSSSSPVDVVERGDGNIWYTDAKENVVGSITESSGLDHTVAVPTSSAGLQGIAEGPDGLLYFSELVAGKIGRVADLEDTPQEQVIPTAGGGAVPEPILIVKGPDGNMWFADGGSSSIGRIVPSTFAITEYATLTPNSQPTGITVGTDGALWFTERLSDRVGRITTAGVVTEYPVGRTGLALVGITSRSNGVLWICAASASGNELIRMTF